MRLDGRKLRREVVRVLCQMARLPALTAEYILGTPWHDRVLRPRQIRTPGPVPASDKVAIYVLFPRQGVRATHLDSLRYLVSHGYSPITVSNLALDSHDREALAQTSMLVMERDNFGYDFGAYREGVLTIEEQLPQLSRLVLLNDSCWFPLPGSRDWLTLAEESGFDYAGAASNYGIDPPDVTDFERLVWSYNTNRRSFHYCSFAISMSPTLIADPDFIRFWRNLRLSDVKARTVRRGEIGLTQWAIRRGYRHGSIFDVVDVDRQIARLDDDELRRHVQCIIIPEYPALRDLIAAVLATDVQESGISRTKLEKLFLMAIARQGMAYTIPVYLHETAGYPFLKKSPIRLDPIAREKTISFLERFGSDANEMLEEIAAELRQR